jgi:hypothetical protein
MKKPDISNDPARRRVQSTRAATGAERRHGSSACGTRALAITGVAALIGAALACFAPSAWADKPDTDSAEFIEFLEYLGSWQGQEEDWVQFLSADEEGITVESLPDAVEPEAESAGL